MAKIQKKRLGDMLIESGVITADQLARAIERQRTTGERLGRVLIGTGVREEEIIRALSQQLGIPVVDLYRESPDPRAAALLPEALARKYRVLPVRKDGNRLLVAMADPLDVVAIDDVAIATGLLVSPAIAPEAEILTSIERTYGLGEHARGIIEEITPSAEDAEAALPVEEPDAPIVRLTNLILTQAITDRASDIHIEPTESAVRVRYRVDGVMNTVMNVPRHAYATLVSRIKVMARMNVAERRLPQDGSFALTAEGRTVDFRVSTIPLIYGERVALRLLDKTQATLNLPDLGMDEPTRRRFESLIKQPNGIILVSGPTGSGKTSTLISALQLLNTTERNIITVEDPVEYQIPGINQMEVNVRAGLTFANALRSIVRQNPDILMVGEIRDMETAEIAIHASLTGHLVFSTIHTNDAPAVVARLLDMGIEPYLIASSIAGAIAQRLVRILCPHCKRPAAAQPEVEMALKSYVGDVGPVQMQERVGCVHCRYTGYLGRTGIFELLVMSGEVRQLIVRRASSAEIGDAARADGMHTMREAGLLKVARGVTTLEEVLRVTTAVDVG